MHFPIEVFVVFVLLTFEPNDCSLVMEEIVSVTSLGAKQYAYVNVKLLLKFCTSSHVAA